MYVQRVLKIRTLQRQGVQYIGHKRQSGWQGTCIGGLCRRRQWTALCQSQLAFKLEWTPHHLPELQPVREPVVHLLRQAEKKSGSHQWQETCGEAPSETCRVDTLEDARRDTWGRDFRVIWETPGVHKWEAKSFEKRETEGVIQGTQWFYPWAAHIQSRYADPLPFPPRLCCLSCGTRRSCNL